MRVDHIGSTAVPGLEAKDVIDIQVTVASLEVADEIADALAGVGYPRIEAITADVAHTDDASLWRKRIHGAADPGRPANVHIRVDGWPNQQFALLFRDWLIANPEVQREYVGIKRKAQDASDYPEAKEPWFADAYRARLDVGRRHRLETLTSDLFRSLKSDVNSCQEQCQTPVD